MRYTSITRACGRTVFIAYDHHRRAEPKRYNWSTFSRYEIGGQLNSTTKKISFWMILILSTTMLLYTVSLRYSDRGAQTVTFSRFFEQVESNNVAEVTISDSDIKGRLKSGETFKTIMPPDRPPVINVLQDDYPQIVIHQH